MAKPEDAAKEYLKGLRLRERKPWDEPTDEKPAPKPSPKPSPSPEPSGDPVGEQVDRIMKRNREFAKRTRYLRKD